MVEGTPEALIRGLFQLNDKKIRHLEAIVRSEIKSEKRKVSCAKYWL